MATSSFNFLPTGIGGLLRTGRLMVPPNQRSYAWRERHVEILLKDLWGTISGQDSDDYFLGTIVLVQAQNNQLTIVDGQQRLATVSIVLARIKDYFNSMRRAGSAQSVQESFLGNIDPRTEELVPRLRLNDENNDFFFRRILTQHPIDQPIDVGAEPMRLSNRRLMKASEKIRTFIADLLKPLPTDQQIDTLVTWLEFLDGKANVLAVYVNDEVSAFRLFETLNDRGLRASQADILKNFFFSKANKRLEEAKAMWATMAAMIEAPSGDRDADDDDVESPARGDPLLTYMRHSWITTHGHTKAKELAQEIREEITTETKSLNQLADFSSGAIDYVALSSSKHSKWADYPPSTRQSIETISEHLRVTQIKPLMLAIGRYFKDTNEADKAFRLCVSWSVRFLIFGGRGGMLDEQYSRRAYEIGSGDVTKARELRDAMKKYVPSDQEFEEAFATARVSKPYLARYYLRAMERTRNEIPHPEFVANEDVRDVTLEHVMPLSWSGDPELAESAQKYLGNMALVSEPMNRNLSDKGFTEKKSILENAGYELTRMIAGYEKWDLDEIRDRQSQLAKIAVRTWTQKFPDDN